MTREDKKKEIRIENLEQEKNEKRERKRTVNQWNVLGNRNSQKIDRDGRKELLFDWLDLQYEKCWRRTSACILSPQSFITLDLLLLPPFLSLSFFLTCNTAYKGINQSRYHPTTMTIVQISKRKNTVISLFSMPSHLDPVLSGTEARLTTLSLYLSYSKEGQRIKDTRGFRGSNMENLSLVIIDVAGRRSFSANATHSKRPTQGERAGMENFKATETIVRQRSLPCVCTSRGEGTQALANVRAHPFDYLRASPAPFLFLWGTLSLFQREERREPMGNDENTPERRIRFSLCAKKTHLHDEEASRRVKAMRRASRWNGVHWFYEHSFDLAFEKGTAVISASQSLHLFSPKW